MLVLVLIRIAIVAVAVAIAILITIFIFIISSIRNQQQQQQQLSKPWLSCQEASGLRKSASAVHTLVCPGKAIGQKTWFTTRAEDSITWTLKGRWRVLGFGSPSPQKPCMPGSKDNSSGEPRSWSSHNRNSDNNTNHNHSSNSKNSDNHN